MIPHNVCFGQEDDMAGNANLDGAAAPDEVGAALPVGGRVWLLRDGRVGRIVAQAQGGLLCRVRLEDGVTFLLRPGCELLRLQGGVEPG